MQRTYTNDKQNYNILLNNEILISSSLGWNHRSNT